MMTNQEILSVALAQSAADSNCGPSDFLSDKNKVVISARRDDARKYLVLPFCCDLTSYGNNIVASVSGEIPNLADEVKKYIDSFPAYHCFETPNMLVLQNALRPHGLEICFMAEYWLPAAALLCRRPLLYQTRLLAPKDFEGFYTDEWSNALCRDRKELDVLAVAAYDGGRIVGMAGCSADCETMWQIGVDVLPSYRRRGIASALVSSLAVECLERGKVPFYCCAWSNVKSARTAIQSGFRPAWVQLTAKPKEFVAGMNKKK